METTRHNSGRVVRFFFIALAGMTLFRGVCNVLFPLTGEEAYYWMWSRHLALCYFDHPPLIAWIIRLFTSVLGHSVFAVRLPALLSHTLTAITLFWCTWRITRDRVTASLAGGFFTVTLFFAATATIAIPDSYLFLFWSLTLWLTIEATREGSSETLACSRCYPGPLYAHQVPRYPACPVCLYVSSYSKATAAPPAEWMVLPGDAHSGTLHPAHLYLEFSGRLAYLGFPARRTAQVRVWKPGILP